MTADQLCALLAAAGCPTDPAAIGSRYIVLDLVNEIGLLGQCVAELFAPGGYWTDNAAGDLA